MSKPAGVANWLYNLCTSLKREGMRPGGQRLRAVAKPRVFHNSPPKSTYRDGDGRTGNPRGTDLQPRIPRLCARRNTEVQLIAIDRARVPMHSHAAYASVGLTNDASHYTFPDGKSSDEKGRAGEGTFSKANHPRFANTGNTIAHPPLFAKNLDL